MSYRGSWLRVRWFPIVCVGLIGTSACASGGSEERSRPTTSEVNVTALAPPLATAVTIATIATLPPMLPSSPEGPWWSVRAPEFPVMQPRPDFAALEGVTSFCIRVDIADVMAIPPVTRVAEMLALMGYLVLNDGCEATFAVDLVGRADPVTYSGGMVCYLERYVAGLIAIIVGEHVLGPWSIDETSPAPTLTTQDNCPGSTEAVSFAFWEDRLPSVMYETFGNIGLAAALLNAGAVQQIGMAKDLQALDDAVEAEFLADPVIMQFLASVVGDGDLATEHLWFIQSLAEALDQRGGVVPAGADLLIPALLRTAESERHASAAWSLIAWITGIPERDPEAAWAWYESGQQP